jgi:hypothetical protein
MKYEFNEILHNETSLLEIAKEEGERTKVTKNVLRVAREIDPNNELHGLDLVETVCTYVRTMIPDESTLKHFRQQNPGLVFDVRTRSADELLSPGNLIPGHSKLRNTDGCNEFAHMTRALLLSKGIPCVFTDTLQEEWVKTKANSWAMKHGEDNPVLGHIFLDVYIEGEDRWYTINPGNREERVHEYGEYSIGGKCYINPISGKDSANIGFPTMKGYLEALEGAIKTKNETSKTEKDYPSEILTQICAIYPFASEEEREGYLKKAVQIENPDPVEEISELLKLLNNPHASIKKRRPNESTRVYELDPEKKPVGEMLENVLYMKVPTFVGVKIEDLEEVFTKYENGSTGLIVDLRGNSGGQQEPGWQFARKYFLNEGEHFFGTHLQIAQEGSAFQRKIYVNAHDKPLYDKPIVILTDNETFSSAEQYVALMKIGANCTIIGTETRGGSANPIREEINIGGVDYVVNIPTWRSFLPGESAPLEETKIKPDIYYDQEDIVDFAIKHVKEAMKPSS